jgi:hypothetical protein
MSETGLQGAEQILRANGISVNVLRGEYVTHQEAMDAGLNYGVKLVCRTEDKLIKTIWIFIKQGGIDHIVVVNSQGIL